VNKLIKLEETLRIETSEIFKDFKNHLKIDNNKRILFSGPFGTGKSTFLNELSQIEDDFFYLKIFPVNYSVSANEDVFDLIKFDLLFQLMGNYYDEIKLKKEDFTLLLRSQVFIMERIKFMPLLYAILGFSEKIGTPIIDFIKALEKTVGDFKEFSDEVKVDEESDIHKFLESIEQKKGNAYEMDAVSELIFDLIERIKIENNKQSVLVIDDLDRLDPEHIFRLFNIFSAHYNEVNGNNKFGFDKIIFVRDIENIRKIFHHRYGFDVDFSGYIDKFYSISPFDFDNRIYVKEKISELLQKIEFSSNLEFYNFKNNEVFSDSARAIIQTLIDGRLLNLRMMLNYPIFVVPDFHFGKNDINSRHCPIIVLFYLLKNFYGSFDILFFKIKNLSESFESEAFKTYHEKYNKSNEIEIESLISLCLFILLPEEIASKRHDTVDFFFLKEYNCTFHFTGLHHGHVILKKIDRATEGDSKITNDVKLNPYKILLDTFELCRKRVLLR
jgi:hypothetical protein